MYMTLASTAISAGGMLMQAKNQKDTANYNARMKEIQAQDLKNQAIIEEQAVRRKGAQLKDEQMAISALNGIEVTTGSASDLISDTAMMTEFDARTVRANAERGIFGLESGAELDRIQGRNQAMQSYLGATGTAIGGYANAYRIKQEYGD
jgi:hypothetical protein